MELEERSWKFDSYCVNCKKGRVRGGITTIFKVQMQKVIREENPVNSYAIHTEGY